MRKILLIILMLVCLFTFAVGVVGGCSGDEPDSEFIEEGTITAGGETIGEQQEKIEIFNAKDIYLGISATENSIISDAYVIEKGIKQPATLDLSNVSFGTAGEYQIKYVYGQLELQNKLYIYGLPEIAGENSITVNYSKVSTDIFNGLTATDSFGNALDLQVIEDGGMIDVDGSFNVSDFNDDDKDIAPFNVKIVAVDMAGQKVEFTRSVTVKEESNPILNDSFIFDVNSSDFSFVLSVLDAKNFVGVSFGGIIVTADYLSQTEVEDGVKFTVSNAFFYDYLLNESLVSDRHNGDVYDVNVLTVKGKTQLDFFLVDSDIVQFDRSDINAFAIESYPSFTEIKIPRVKLTNKYQSVTPTYTMIDANGEDYEVTNGFFSFDKAGDWTLKVDLRDGQSFTQKLNAYYDLGLEDGSIYGGNNLFTGVLPDGYDFVEYNVNLNGNEDALVLECKDAQNLDAFIEGVHNLNTKNVYQMNVIAEKDGKIYTQSADFTVVKNGVGVMSNTANASDLAVNNSEYASLTYTNKTVGGRSGVYEWKGLKEGTVGDNSKILFTGAVTANMQKDRYLTFDIYYTGGLALNIKLGDNSMFLWDFYPEYESKADYAEEFPNNVANVSDAFCGGLVKFYDQDGKQIVDGADPVLQRINQWITVEIKISVEGIASGAGISTYSSYYKLDGKEVYISNMRISDNSLLSDDTQLNVIQKNDEVVFEDIWTNN